MEFLGLLTLIGSLTLIFVVAIRTRKIINSVQNIYLANVETVDFEEKRKSDRNKDTAINRFMSIDCTQNPDDVVLSLITAQFEAEELLD